MDGNRIHLYCICNVLYWPPLSQKSIRYKINLWSVEINNNFLKMAAEKWKISYKPSFPEKKLKQFFPTKIEYVSRYRPHHLHKNILTSEKQYLRFIVLWHIDNHFRDILHLFRPLIHIYKIQEYISSIAAQSSKKNKSRQSLRSTAA